MDTLLLDGDDVDENARLADVIPAVEDAFRAYAEGRTVMPAKSYIDLPAYNGDFRSMPAYLDVRDGSLSAAGEAGDWDAAAIKWVNVHPDNPADHDLPTVLGIVVYSDPETAFPLAVMDGTVLTRKRTGAAAAVATDHLAVEDATSVGIVGAGVQSYTQLEAIRQVRPIEEVVIADRNPEKVRSFVETFEDHFDVRGGSVAEAASCDVLSTVTPVRDPVVDLADVSERTHVNAMGADAEGKHELSDELLLAATVVIDDYEQCTHSGEINVPWSAGVLGNDDLHGEIGNVVSGTIAGRTPDDGVTVFDSTGLAIQDVAAAHVVYEHADEVGNGTCFELLRTETDEV